MPSILQTLYPASARIRQLLAFNSTGVETPNTPAGTHDGSNATRDAAEDSGNSDLISPSIAYAVDYVLDTAAAAGTIDFVRERMRQRKYASASASASMRPLIAGVARGTVETTVDEAFIERVWDFTTDPADGLPWTNAKINAQRWGFTGVCADPNVFTSAFVEVAEIVLELWSLTASGGTALAGEVEAGPTVAGVPVGGAVETDAGTLTAGLGVHVAGEIWMED